MTNTISSSMTSALNVVGGDTTIINSGVTIASLGNHALGLTGTNTLVRNAGQIDGIVRFGVAMNAVDSVLFNSIGASIKGKYAGLSVSGMTNVLVNDGDFEGRLAGILMNGASDTRIKNAGDISGVFNGVLFQAGNADNQINNSGHIFGTANNANGISIALGNTDTKIVNTGMIDGIKYGILNAGAGTTVQNAGSIAGATGIYVSHATTIINDGTISGTLNAIFSASMTDPLEVTNRGTVSGNVVFSSGNDILRNTDAINGSIVLGDGNDSFSNKGLVAGSIDMGNGNDVYAGDFATSAVSVKGGAGDDQLRGSAFADILAGGDGDDVIKGGGGADIITGGAGKDFMLGGAGADTFVFKATTDSGAAFDIISDFQVGLDVIDLAALNAGTLAFVGTSGFVGGGQGSVGYDIVGGTKYVHVDADGDGISDMQFMLRGAGGLTSDEFIL